MAKKKPTEPKLDDVSPEAGLNPKQEAFCRYYTQASNTFGNATLSYAEAYEYDLGDLERYDKDGNLVVEKEYKGDYGVCSSNGHRLLRNDKVQARVTVLLNEHLKDEVVDGEL